jgi:hypothetical protein
MTDTEGSHTHTIIPDEAPSDVIAWLHHRGWFSSNQYGYFTRNDVMHDGQTLNLTWEQAIAYEMYKIITIGGHSG